MKTTTMLVSAAALLIAGCTQPGIKGDGVIKTESRVITGFEKLVATGGYDIKWSGGSPALTITTDQNLLPLINTTVSGNTLTIESKDNLAPTNGIYVTVSSSALIDAQLTGGTSFAASGISGPHLSLGGTGSTEITVAGSVVNLNASLTGAGNLNAKALPAQNATLSLTGASSAQVSVSGTLNASITGAGSVTYSGNPTVEQHITGAGSIQRE